MKKFVSLVLSAILLLALCACGGSGAKTLNGTLAEITEKACNAADFSSASFTYMSDEYSDEVLMFTYGLEDEAVCNAVEDFVLSSRSGMFAATFAVIRFKDGSSDSVIENARSTITEMYVTPLIGALKPYDPEQAAIAEKYQFKSYGNTLVLVICAEGADTVFNAIEG